MLGTEYCFMHYPKRAPVVALFAGALLSVAFQFLLDSVTVSDEEKRIIVLSADVRARDDRIHELETASKQARRGVVDIYKFNGDKWEASGRGNFTVANSTTQAVFQRMSTLKKQQAFSELIPLCQLQIRKTPEWLTPYLWLGEAYAATGQRESALLYLRQVVREAPGDPDYADAEELVGKLEHER
jgi:tetratricopeptide (TPR) repeat protein